MSVMIETTEELQTLLKKLGVKVNSVDDLRSLLATINAHYNPEAARVRTAKLVAIFAPCGLGAIACIATMMLTMGTAASALVGRYFVGALALVWGACALVSVTALIFSFSLLIGRRSRVAPGAYPPSDSAPQEQKLATAITRELSL